MSSDTLDATIDIDAKLVRMANQIAGFFDTQPHADKVAETANHLREFWDPRMRAQLQEYLGKGGDGLSPLALAAAKRLAEMA